MTLLKIQQKIINCNQCARLLDWCGKIATKKRKSFGTEIYWGKPVPGFGNAKAQILILGLAPAAHGANRTGRMFTGDNSGIWLYRALFEHGYSSHAESKHRTDSLHLSNVYITAVVHCAPPDNKPSNEEIQACVGYLKDELDVMRHVKVILALGALHGIRFRTLEKKKAGSQQKPNLHTV